MWIERGDTRRANDQLDRMRERLADPELRPDARASAQPRIAEAYGAIGDLAKAIEHAGEIATPGERVATLIYLAKRAGETKAASTPALAAALKKLEQRRERAKNE